MFQLVQLDFYQQLFKLLLFQQLGGLRQLLQLLSSQDAIGLDTPSTAGHWQWQQLS